VVWGCGRRRLFGHGGLDGSVVGEGVRLGWGGVIQH